MEQLLISQMMLMKKLDILSVNSEENVQTDTNLQSLIHQEKN